MRRAFAMRQMAQNFRGEMARPSVRGQMLRNHRGPGASEGKGRPQFQQRSEKAKGPGRHQEVRGRKGKGPRQSAVKSRGPKKERSAKHKKGIQKRRGDKKGDNEKGKNSKRNRNGRS